MPIDRIGGSGGADRTEKYTGRDPQPVAPEAERREVSDRLDLSEGARRIKALADRARELPELRNERIEELKRALADGTYRIDPKRVAAALVDFEDGFNR